MFNVNNKDNTASIGLIFVKLLLTLIYSIEYNNAIIWCFIFKLCAYLCMFESSLHMFKTWH